MTNLIGLDLESDTSRAFCVVLGPGDLGPHTLNEMTTVSTVEYLIQFALNRLQIDTRVWCILADNGQATIEFRLIQSRYFWSG